MKRIILGIAMLCANLYTYAQSYDINEDGQVSVADITTLVDGITKGEKGKLYYSKEQIDNVLGKLNKRIELLEDYLQVAFPYKPRISFTNSEIKTHVGLDITMPKINTNSDGEITYTSNNNNVISIDEHGIGKALSKGTATITANVGSSEWYESSSCSLSVIVSEIPEIPENYIVYEKTYETPGYIDLGLPSGTLWLDKNVGSSGIYHVGNSIKNSYNYSYNFSTFINNCVCPSLEQWQELISLPHTLVERTNYAYYEFTGYNGNKLILPVDSYWTSSHAAFENYYSTYFDNLVEGCDYTIYITSCLDIDVFNCYVAGWLIDGNDEYYYTKKKLRLVVK